MSRATLLSEFPSGTGDITAQNVRDLVNATLLYAGPWSSATAYLQNDVVEESGAIYLCLIPNTNSQPPSSNWLAIGGSIAGLLQAASNLSDLASAATARTNLGLGSAAVASSSSFDAAGAAAAVLSSSAQKSNNLSDLASAATARTNLGLGTIATENASAVLQVANNLGDVSNAAAARTNLGLGSASTASAASFLQVTNNLSDLNNVATARANLGLGLPYVQSSSSLFARVPKGVKLAGVVHAPPYAASSTFGAHYDWNGWAVGWTSTYSTQSLADITACAGSNSATGGLNCNYVRVFIPVTAYLAGLVTMAQLETMAAQIANTAAAAGLYVCFCLGNLALITSTTCPGATVSSITTACATLSAYLATFPNVVCLLADLEPNVYLSSSSIMGANTAAYDPNLATVVSAIKTAVSGVGLYLPVSFAFAYISGGWYDSALYSWSNTNAVTDFWCLDSYFVMDQVHIDVFASGGGLAYAQKPWLFNEWNASYNLGDSNSVPVGSSQANLLMHPNIIGNSCFAYRADGPVETGLVSQYGIYYGTTGFTLNSNTNSGLLAPIIQAMPRTSPVAKIYMSCSSNQSVTGQTTITGLSANTCVDSPSLAQIDVDLDVTIGAGDTLEQSMWYQTPYGASNQQIQGNNGQIYAMAAAGVGRILLHQHYELILWPDTQYYLFPVVNLEAGSATTTINAVNSQVTVTITPICDPRLSQYI